MIVFTTTSPLIALASIQRIDLLPRLFGTVRATVSVVQECQAGGGIVVPDLSICEWLSIVPVADGLIPSFRDAARGMLEAGIRFHPGLIEKLAIHVGEPPGR